MTKPERTWPFALLLVVQNLVTYRSHYFGTAGIPWDFSLSYFGMVAFWTSLVRDGVLPQWVPFQQMGYPFALQMQSGVNYLPFWIFPLLGIRYTLRAAIVFQCLHVLAAGFGMFQLARSARHSKGEAFVAAVAYQAFGGFFSNAEHPDIVRAYALTPWLLYAFSFERPVRDSLPRRAWLIPPVLFLFLTGAYPGNVISAGLIVGVYVALQVIAALTAEASLRRTLQTTGTVVGLAALGCGMAVIHLGPVWLFRDLYFRAEALSATLRFGLWLEHLPGLIFSNARLPGEVSMTSTFVTLPVLIFASLAPMSAIRARWPLVMTAVLAACLAAGDHLPGGTALRDTIHLLGLSRFPSSDYRAFVAIALILLALPGLRAISTKEDTAASLTFLGWRLVFCAVWFMLVLRLTDTEPVNVSLGIGMWLLSVGVVTGIWLRAARVSVAVIVLAAGLVAVDAVRVLPDIPGWREPDMESYYPRQGSPPYTRNRGRRLAPEYIFENLPQTRPAREFPEDLTRWSGYINGRYYLNDLTPNVLKNAATVMASESYRMYMSSAWTPLLVAPADRSGPLLELPESLFAPAADASSRSVPGTVRQTRYGINDITYDVSLSEPALLVENEMFFPGWRAQLGGHMEAVEAVAVNGTFRAWQLPAGTYTMTARFQLPHLTALRVMAGTCALIWLGLVAASRRHASNSTPHA